MSNYGSKCDIFIIEKNRIGMGIMPNSNNVRKIEINAEQSQILAGYFKAIAAAQNEKQVSVIIQANQGNFARFVDSVLNSQHVVQRLTRELSRFADKEPVKSRLEKTEGIGPRAVAKAGAGRSNPSSGFQGNPFLKLEGLNDPISIEINVDNNPDAVASNKDELTLTLRIANRAVARFLPSFNSSSAKYKAEYKPTTPAPASEPRPRVSSKPAPRPDGM